CTRSGVWDYW
nr:immunoglobulin heavy chain junction region [Mus musculus]